MSIFVVDTNVFSRAFRNMTFSVFDEIWEPWTELMMNGTIISVEEVYRELIVCYGDKTDKMDWLKTHKESFKPITNEDGKILSEIFQSKKFCEGIKEASIRAGSPEADAILVAKAKTVKGIIVTTESNSKPNAEKIPNICVSLGVPFMLVDDFYLMLHNVYKGIEPLCGVKLRCEIELIDDSATVNE